MLSLKYSDFLTRLNKIFMKQLIAWFYKRQNGWFTLTAISAFIAMISYFQINSYKADLHKLNGFWLIMGIVFTLGALFFIWKANNTSTGTGG